MINKYKNNFLITEKLFKFFNDFSKIPPKEWLFLLGKIRIQKYEKNHILFSQGVSSNYIGFVACGLVHTYFEDQNGKQKTKNFAWEGRLISPWTSILQKIPSHFTAITLEETTIIELDSYDLNELIERHICWERLVRKVTEKLLIEREKREYSTLMLDTQSRLNVFEEDYKALKERIPQYLIASYLGITPEALSRVRSTR